MPTLNPEKVFSRFAFSNERSLGSLSQELFGHQLADWPLLAKGVAALKAVHVRNVECDGFSVKLQFNPQRIVSTSASVDAVSVAERQCFLCAENLPREQQGVLYRDEFLVLCNPAPIFEPHFTISHVQHVPQSIDQNLETMLKLTREMSPEFSIFYNGPRCGASAPDHLHFQAAPRNSIPVEVDAVDAHRRKVLHKSGAIALLSLKKYGRSALVVESTSQEELAAFLRELFTVWKGVQGISDEPMMNLIATFRQEVWRVILFPRSKHRPDAYFKEGEERIVVSPAAVDIGGLVVIPLKKDFERLDATTIESIFAEVSLGERIMAGIVNRVIV
jgi:diadenosine tetraphosphate (Ap4A) HIT family hydrolase